MSRLPPLLDRLSAALADRYQITRVLGAGGMAIVYHAEDLKHRRSVAIKVLREELTVSLGGTRFLREIGIAARLQHPNILPLLDSGDADGILYYVMPFVEGLSLRQRLNRDGALPIGEALRILIEVVDGLACAHASGVVHRDIKPDNVMLSGRHALVTDFGVARALSAATNEQTMTGLGVALGTPTYMSPEQAAADSRVDHRADLYSVGVMGYEMIAGRPPFVAESPQQLLAAHISATPSSLRTFAPGVSAQLEHIVMKGLAKNPDERWQSAEQLLGQLEPLVAPSGETSSVPRGVRKVGVSRSPKIVALAATIVVLVVGLFAWRSFGPSRGGTRKGSAPIAIGKSSHLTTDEALEVYPALSPDGKSVAYAMGNAVRWRIFLRPAEGGRMVALSDDATASETMPRWSPDGSEILFVNRSGVWIAPAGGGRPRHVVTVGAQDSIFSAAWSPDGQAIGYSKGDSVFARKLDGSATRLIGTGQELHSCAWSPDDRWIACASGNSGYVLPSIYFGNLAPSSLVLIPTAGGKSVTVVPSTSLKQSPIWSPDGKFLYFVSDREGTRDVYCAAVSKDGRIDGAPIRLTLGLNAQSISMSADGRRMAYAVYTERANIWTMPILEKPLSPNAPLTAVTKGAQVVEAMRLSSDGQWLLYDSTLPGRAEIYRVRLPDGVPEQLTKGRYDNFRPDLSPDGTEIVFQSFRGNSREIFVETLDGGTVQQVTSSPMQEAGPIWSPDGHSIAFGEVGGKQGAYVMRRDAAGHWGAPKTISRSWAGASDWSPDSRRVVSVVDGSVLIANVDSGVPHTIYAPRQRTSDPQMEQVVWPRNSQSLYLKSHDAEGRATFWTMNPDGGAPKLLTRLDDLSRPSNRPDFATDGKRLYFGIQDRQSDVWVAELSRP